MKFKLIPGPDAVDISGDYKAKLFVPNGSSLKQFDIDRISSIVTWRKDPNELSDVILSGRSVIIDPGLQISGVGYLPVSIGLNNDSSIGYEESHQFLKPSNNNFLDSAVSNGHAKQVMGWTSTSPKKEVYEVGFYELINHVPDYKPAGTYDYDELSKKVVLTNKASKLKLKKLITPNLMAYGYYSSDELGRADGLFGFIVTTTPSKAKERFAQELFTQHASVLGLINGLSKLSVGLRELHDNGFVHLQPHASNFYLTGNKPYLMDWSTAKRLGVDKELNTVYRALDLVKLANNYESILKLITLNPKPFLLEGISSIMSSYVGARVDVMDLVNKASRAMNHPSDFDVIVQSLLEYNVEGFAQRPKKLLVKTAEESMAEFMKKCRIKETTKTNKTGYKFKRY
ncbi:MAG: hypothetical protein WC307_02935 [Candidatus Nanoarchaeia archaeon]|jgi:hypothetical protein